MLIPLKFPTLQPQCSARFKRDLLIRPRVGYNKTCIWQYYQHLRLGFGKHPRSSGRYDGYPADHVSKIDETMSHAFADPKASQYETRDSLSWILKANIINLWILY